MGSSAFSLFTNAGLTRPQVFINFRGKELRDGFVAFLVKALREAKINVYIDEHETRGEDLNHLFNRIKKSRVVITIFSKDYTESKWCLDELAEIKECLDRGSLRVIPIFFQIKTDHVKKIRGKFGDNFRELKKKCYVEHDKYQRWKEAIECVSGRFGLSSDNKKQPVLVTTIVEEVIKNLKEVARINKINDVRNGNHMAARTEEMVTLVVYVLSFIVLLALVLGPYVLCLVTLVSVLSFFLGRSIINGVMEIEW